MGVYKKIICFDVDAFKIFYLSTRINCLFLVDYRNLFQILKINPKKKDIDSFVGTDFKLIGYDPHQKIEMKMAV